jgi:hypothetical protein
MITPYTFNIWLSDHDLEGTVQGFCVSVRGFLKFALVRLFRNKYHPVQK